MGGGRGKGNKERYNLTARKHLSLNIVGFLLLQGPNLFHCPLNLFSLLCTVRPDPWSDFIEHQSWKELLR